MSLEDVSRGFETGGPRIWLDECGCPCPTPTDSDSGPRVIPPGGNPPPETEPPPIIEPPPEPGEQKPYLSGVIHLLSAPNGNFWNNLENNDSNNRAWIDGYRGRTDLRNIKPNGIFNVSNWAGPDSAVEVCRTHGKKLSLNVSMGLDMPTDFYTASPTTGFITVVTDADTTGPIPLIWEDSYFTKIAPVIAEMGLKYDDDPVIGQIFMTGYQQQVELHVVNNDADGILYNNAAVAAGFADKSEAWVETTIRIVDLWMAAFPNTPVMFTLGNPWGGGSEGVDDRNAVRDYMFATYPEHGGVCSSFLHATLEHTGVPELQTYPIGDQAIFASSDTARFYAPPLNELQPPAPQPVEDLLKNGFDQGDQYVEVYRADIEDPTNNIVIQQQRLRLISNVPVAHR